MYIELAAAAYLLAEFAYHRWFEDKPSEPRQRVTIPHTEEGTPVGLLFGRTLVRQPILAWGYVNNVGSISATAYLLYVVAIGCDDGSGTNRVHQMWVGDEKLSDLDALTGSVDADENWTQTGDGGPESPIIDAGAQWIEVLNGNPDQVLAEDDSTTADAPTYAGRRMLEVMTAESIPGYRGYISVFLHRPDSASNGGWSVPLSGMKAFAFEASSYHDGHAELGTFNRTADDLNPVNALFLLLKDKLGKLGLDESYIDVSGTFKAAQYTLRTEGQGYSRCIDVQASGDEHIQEILRQIDGALDVDLKTNKIVLTLVRPDFDPNSIPHITRENCVKLANFSFGGWPELTNRVTVKFTDRNNNYQDGTESTPNQGNAVAQGSEEEVVLEYPGVHYRELAKRIAAREIAYRSRPPLKFRAYVSRAFIRVVRGQAVKVTWSNPDLSGVIMRVANVERGTLEDGTIALDLVSDAFYTWRGRTPQRPDFGIPDSPAVVLGS